MSRSNDSSASLRHAALLLLLLPVGFVSYAVGKPGDDDETKKKSEPKGARAGTATTPAPVKARLPAGANGKVAAEPSGARPTKYERERPRLPGVQPGGKVLLPNGWSLRPAGEQVQLGDFPVNIALHPKEPYAAIVHSGYGEHEVVIVNLATEKAVSRVSLGDTFYGATFDPER